MGWTKQQLVTQAFEEIGLASYVFDLSPEQLQSALRTMDAMVARWDGAGVELGYALPSSPESSSLNDEAGIPDTAAQAVYLGLACLLGPRFGKAIPPDLRTNAKNAYDEIVTRLAVVPEQQLPVMVSGAGNRHSGTPFTPAPDTDAGDLDFLGD